MNQSRVISVFGSNTPLPGSKDYELARELGYGLAKVGYAVATGGYSGTMAAVSQGAAEGNGHVIGVTSRQIEDFRQVQVNPWVAKEILYDSLADRLMHLVLNNDGMVVLPGGIGTLSEFALAWSFLQVGEIKDRPLILIGSFWQQVTETFINPQYVLKAHVGYLTIAKTPAEAISSLQASTK